MSPLERLPLPPERVSMTDAQLLEAAGTDAGDHDTGALLDLVERQLELRQSEALRLQEWEQQVRAAKVPEAEQLVAQVRAQFTGVVAVIPAASAVVAPDSPSVAEQLASASPPAAPPSGPMIEFALADAPPPYGIVPSVVAPPPGEAAGVAPDVSAAAEVPVPPLVEPIAPAPLDTPPDAVTLLFDDLLREPQPEQSSSEGEAVEPAAVLAGATVAGAALVDASSVTAEASNFLPVDVPVHSLTIMETHPTVAPPRAARVEVSALEPTPAEQRAGRSVRLFWLWFAVNASVVSVALGAVILGLGISLRQAVLATLIGVAISFLPLGLGTLAGKWSGQPTMVVSRATFGVKGNWLPAILALITRLAWAAALLWMLGSGVAEVLVGSGLVGAIGRLELTIAAAALGLVLSAVIAGFGFAMIAVVGAVVSVLSAVLVGGLIVLTASYVDLDTALSVPDGDWLLMVSGAVLVFSVVGLAWANSSGDVARYQAKGTFGSSAVLFSAFGATIPAFVLMSWGAILAASNPVLAEGLQSNPIDLLARLLPLWYPAPLIAAVSLSLVLAAGLTLYSSGFALLSTGLRAPRPVGVALSVVVTGAVIAVLIVLVPDVSSLFRDVVTTLAVPVAAWAGIFGAETMIRTRRVHSPSLLRSGGVYPAVRWVNLIMLIIITAVGWGLSTAAITGLQWQGYLFSLLGVDAGDPLAASDPGVLLALLLGLLTPLVAGIPALRRLQTAERAAAEADSVIATSDAVPTPTTEAPRE